MSKNKFELKTIHQLEGLHFLVEKYQRGYKWDIIQVKELLKDIEEFKPIENGFYCLQPIVVKKIVSALPHQKDSYELIDGQQRTTTLFIIFNLLKKENVLDKDFNLFNIRYRTRPESENFLKEIANLDIDLPNDKILDRITTNILWETYIKNAPENDNVDNYHFFSTYCIVLNWLKQKGQVQIDKFKSNLLYNTKVIWYHDISNNSSENIFINFNQGKIDLAQAELIKALFVLQLKKETNKEIQTLRLNQFSEEWNAIENKLQDNSFWYFVSNDTSEKDRANRIELLFNIVKEKPFDHLDKLYSYRLYLKDYNNLNKSSNKSIDPLKWFEIKNTFDILLEWYEDRSIFHLIGFIIYEKISNIRTIIENYNKKPTKSSFKNFLIDLIKAKFFAKNEKYLLDNLGYDTPRETHSILLLFNIISYENSDYSYRFPFHLFKESYWSLEHIHAQNPKKFETIKEVKDWVNDIKILDNDFKSNSQKSNLDYSELKIILDKLNEGDSIPRDLKEHISKLEDLSNNLFNKHSIENLCLLDGVTNSHFNNDTFSNKRRKLLEIDSGTFVDENNNVIKSFIPLATKNVFLKYYTQATSFYQMSYWGYQDRKQYLSYINKTLKVFFNLTSSTNGN